MVKKIIACILSIGFLCTALVGCDEDNSIDNKITQYTIEGKTTKLVPDETATGDLTVDFSLYYHSDVFLNDVEKMYKELYPNVNLMITRKAEEGVTFEENAQQLQAEIMAGRGPDVFLSVGEVLDPYKTMKAGAYANLAPYFENDKNFNIEDFNKNVFYSGQMDGEQYLVPTEYNLPIYMTTQSIVDETGFDFAKCKDFFSTGDEIGRILKENKLGCRSGNECRWFSSPYYLLIFGGFSWIDYNKNTANIDTPEIKKAYTMLKESFYPYLEFKDGRIPNSYGIFAAGKLNRKETIFAELSGDPMHSVVSHSKALTGLGDKPVLFPWRNANGGITATSAANLVVGRNSENIPNAYNFIKLMISEELNKKMIDGDGSGAGMGLFRNIPINNKVTQYFFEKNKGETGVKEGYFDGEEAYQLEVVPDELIEQYMSIIGEVEGTFFDPQIGYTMQKYMRPFLEDKKSYEDCIQEAQGHLEIYASE